MDIGGGNHGGRRESGCAPDECEDAGGLACSVLNVFCLAEARSANASAAGPANLEPETLFWQSIVDSTDPANFEPYLEQFPYGAFRCLAENRLAALSSTSDRNPPRRTGNDSRSRISHFGLGAAEPSCAGQPEGAACWLKLESHSGCYV